jgi:hypothetical protein
MHSPRLDPNPQTIHFSATKLQKTDLYEKPLAAPVALSELPNNPAKRLFDLAVKKGILSADGQYIFDKYPPFLELNSQSLDRLFQAFRQLGIAEALLHTISKLEKLGIDVNNIISICGSGVLFVLGEEYVAARLNDVGLNIYEIFTRDELNEIFKKAADLDVRFDLRKVKPPVTNDILKELGQGMRGFIETNKTSSKIFVKGGAPWDKPVDLGFARCYALSVENATEVVDVFFGAEMPTDYLSAYDNCFLPLSKETLLAFASNNAQEIEKIKIVPFGIGCTGIRALILRMSGCWIADKLGSIDFRGALKFLISFADGRKPLHEETIDKLFGNLFSFLDNEKSKYAMKELHRALNNHFLRRPAAHISVFFNVLKLLFSKLSKENRMNDWKKLKDKILAPPNQIMKWETSEVSPTFEALLALLRNDNIGYDVVSSYLLLQIQLLANRTKNMGQMADIKVCSDTFCHDVIAMLTLEGPGTTLQITSDIVSALTTLSRYFKDAPLDEEILKSLQTLCHPFFQGIKAEFPLSKDNEECSEKRAELISHMAPHAEQLLESKYKPLKLLGFLLLCQYGMETSSSTYLPLLSKRLIELLSDTSSRAQHIAILRYFLQYMERCRPSDCLFHVRDKIVELLTKIDRFIDCESMPLECCKILASSNDKSIAEAILKFIQQQPYKTFMPQAMVMINKYLSMSTPAPSLALQVLETLIHNKQVSYEKLDTHLNLIFDSYGKSLNLYIDLGRLAIAAKSLLAKKGSTDRLGEGAKVYLKIADELFEKNCSQEAIELVDLAETAGAFKDHGQAMYEIRKKVAFRYARDEQWLDAIKQWIKAIQHFNALPTDCGVDIVKLIDPLLKIKQSELSLEAFKLWQQALLECATDKLPAGTALNLLDCMSQAFASLLPHKDFTSRFQFKGSWLLKQIKEHPKNGASLNLYFSLPHFLDPNSEERKIADSILGPHCFGAFIAKQLEIDFLSPERQITTITNEMLKANSPLIQVCGFALLCQLEKSDESEQLLKTVIQVFPNLLISDECIDKRQLLFDQLAHFLEKCSPDFISKQQLMKLSHCLKPNSSKDAICQSFCLAFSTSNACDTVFSTWQKMESKIGIETGIKLVESYQEKYPEWALNIMASLAQQGKLTVTEKARNFWSNFLLYHKKNPEGLAKNLLNLTEIAKSMISRIGIKGTVINKSELGADICWLIEQLLSVDNKNSAIELYEAAEGKKLITDISISNSAWLNLCSHLYNTNKKSKAYALCKRLIANQPNDVTLWLLQQNAEGLDSTFIELMLKGISTTSDLNQGLLLTQRIIDFLNSGIDKKALEGLHKIVKNNLIPIFSMLHRSLEEGNEKAPEVFCSLFALLPNLGLDVSSIMNDQKLWPILHQQLLSEKTKTIFQPFCKQLIDASDIQSKEKFQGKAKVYFLLAKNQCLETSLNNAVKCFERAINSSSANYVLEDEDLKFAFNILNKMKEKGSVKDSCKFLEKIEKYCPDSSKQLVLVEWETFIKQLVITTPLLATEYLIQKNFLLSPTEAPDKFRVIVSDLCLYHIKDNKGIPFEKLLKLASIYHVTASYFWLAVFNKMTLLDDETYKALSTRDNIFTGSKKDCQNCWLKFLEIIKSTQSKYIINHLQNLARDPEIQNNANPELNFLLFKALLFAIMDKSVMNLEKESIIHLTEELRLILTIESNRKEEFNLLQLQFADHLLNDQSENHMLISAKILVKPGLDLSNCKEKYIEISNKIILSFLELKLTMQSPLGNELINLVTSTHWKEFDPIQILMFDSLILNRINNRLSILIELIYKHTAENQKRPKNNYKEFIKNKKEEIRISLDRFFNWYLEENLLHDLQIMVDLVQATNLIPLENIAYWNGMYCSTQMVQLLASNEVQEYKPQQLLFSLNTFLPTIIHSEDITYKCLELAAKVQIYSGQTKPSHANLNFGVDIINLMILLKFFFNSDPNITRPCTNALFATLGCWLNIVNDENIVNNSAIEEFARPVFSKLTELTNTFYSVHKETKENVIKQNQSMLHDGRFLKKFLSSFVEQLIIAINKTDNIETAYKLCTIYYFHTTLMINLYQEVDIAKSIFDFSNCLTISNADLFVFHRIVSHNLFTEILSKTPTIYSPPTNYTLMLGFIFNNKTLFDLYDEINIHTSFLNIIRHENTKNNPMFLYRTISILKTFQNICFGGQIDYLSQCYSELMQIILITQNHSEQLWDLLFQSLNSIDNIENNRDMLLSPVFDLIIQSNNKIYFRNVISALKKNIANTQNTFACFNLWTSCLLKKGLDEDHNEAIKSNLDLELIYNDLDLLKCYLLPYIFAFQIPDPENATAARIILDAPVVINNDQTINYMCVLLTEYLNTMINQSHANWKTCLELITYFEHLSFFSSEKYADERVLFKVSILNLIQAVAIKQNKDERNKYVHMLLSTPLLNDEISANVIESLRSWTELIQQKRYTNEINLIILADQITNQLTNLFFNYSPLVECLFTKYLDQLSVDYLKDTISTTLHVKNIFAKALINNVLNKSLDPDTYSIPFWQHFGDILSCNKIIKCNESINAIIECKKQYFKAAIHHLFLEKNRLRKCEENYQYLLDFLQRVQNLSYMNEKCDAVLSLYKELAPLAIKQDKLGRQRFFESLTNYFLMKEAQGNVSVTLKNLFFHVLDNMMVNSNNEFTEEIISIIKDVKINTLSKKIFYSSEHALELLFNLFKNMISIDSTSKFLDADTSFNAYLFFRGLYEPEFPTFNLAWKLIGLFLTKNEFFPKTKSFLELRTNLIKKYFDLMVSIYQKNIDVNRKQFYPFLRKLISNNKNLLELKFQKKTVIFLAKQLEAMVEPNSNESKDHRLWNVAILNSDYY